MFILDLTYMIKRFCGFDDKVGQIYVGPALCFLNMTPSRLVPYLEVGTSNIISKAQLNKAQQSSQQVKTQRKMHNLIFAISETQCNFRNVLFDSVEAQSNANTAFFAILDWKRVNSSLKKADIYPDDGLNGAKLSSMYRISLLTEKNFESAGQ